MPARDAAKREAAKLARRRQRERQRERAIEAAKAEAERQERAAELVASSFMRQPVMSPTGMVVGPRVHIVNGRAVRALAIGTKNDPGGELIDRSPSFTEQHKRAARMLQHDWHDVGAGLGVSASDFMRTGGGSGGGHNQAMIDQIDMRRRLEGAFAHLGAFAPGIARVILDGVPVSVWITELPGENTLASGIAWIAAGLQRLCGFYWPAAEAKDTQMRTFAIGPARSSYSVALTES